MSSQKRKVVNKIKLSDIEREIKRALSNREVSAILDLRGQLPDDRRKRKRLIRKAREAARLEDLKDPEILSSRGEPTDDELRKAVDFLSTWQTPDAFSNKLMDLRRRIPICKLMDGRYKFVREGIVLSTFSKYRKLHGVKLGEDPPDARVRFDPNSDEPIEITVALENRKPHDEFRTGSLPLLTHFSDTEADQLAEQMVRKLEASVEAKAKKYDTPPRLLVYLNFPHNERAEKPIEDTVNQLRNKHASDFRGIHVLTDRRMF